MEREEREEREEKERRKGEEKERERERLRETAKRFSLLRSEPSGNTIVSTLSQTHSLPLLLIHSSSLSHTHSSSLSHDFSFLKTEVYIDLYSHFPLRGRPFCEDPAAEWKKS